MTLKFLTTFFLFTVIVFSQADSLVTYYPNGSIESITYLKNSLREGKSILFYENGNIKEERNYQNDKINGVIRVYHPNGQIKEIFNKVKKNFIKNNDFFLIDEFDF